MLDKSKKRPAFWRMAFVRSYDPNVPQGAPVPTPPPATPAVPPSGSTGGWHAPTQVSRPTVPNAVPATPAVDKAKWDLDTETHIAEFERFFVHLDPELLKDQMNEYRRLRSLPENQNDEGNVRLLSQTFQILHAKQEEIPDNQVILVQPAPPPGASRAKVVRPRPARRSLNKAGKIGCGALVLAVAGLAIFIAFSLINQPQTASNRPVVATATATTQVVDSQVADEIVASPVAPVDETPLVDTAMPTSTQQPTHTPRPTSTPTETPCVGRCAIATGEAYLLQTREAYSNNVATSTAVAQQTRAAVSPTP